MTHPAVTYVESYPGFRGAQQSLTALIGALESDVRPTVLITTQGRSAAGFERAGLHVESLDMPARLNRFHGALTRLWQIPATLLLGIIPGWFRFLQRWRRERPALVHCNQARGLLLAGPPARLLGIPVVWHLRGISTESRLMQSVLGRIASRIIAVSTAVADSLSGAARRRTVVVYNGIAPSRHEHGIDRARADIVRLRQERTLDENGFTLLTTSSLVPYKGLHHVASALRFWIAAQPDAANRILWVVLGDDDGHAPKREYKEHVEAILAAGNVTRNVAWVGWQDDPSSWMASVDATVLPTVQREVVHYASGTTVDAICSEGFPRTLLEAMAAGSTIVASRVAGVGEQIEDDRHGILVPPSDAETLAAALRRLADAPELRARLVAAARERVTEFTIERMRNGVLAVYRQLGVRV